MGHLERYSEDWFSANVGNWNRWLADFKGKPAVRCLEIGSFEGRSTVWLLKNILTGEGSSIDCHDIFEERYYPRFVENIGPWQDRVQVHRGLSSVTLRYPVDWFEFAYIDGDHAPLSVLADATLSWHAVKVGGVVIFDDYLWLPPELSLSADVWTQKRHLQQIARHAAYATKTGIDAFLQVVTGQFEVIGQGYQLAVRKTRARPA